MPVATRFLTTMGRGSITSLPNSPIKGRHFEKDSITIDDVLANETREILEKRSEPPSARFEQMETADSLQEMENLDLEKQSGDGSRPKDKLKNSRARLTLWMVLNTVATVAIV